MRCRSGSSITSILALSCMILLGVRGSSGQSSPSAELSLPEQTVTPGSTVPFPVTLYSNDTDISAIQFDIDYDAAALSIDTQAGELLQSAGKSAAVADPTSNSRRIVIHGMNQSRIPNGTVLVVMVTAKADLSQASYAIRLRDAVAADSTGTSVPISTRDGNITVSQSGTVRIDTIRNAASLTEGPIAAGELVSVFGAGFRRQVQVLVNDVQAPLLYADEQQINAVIPNALGNGSSAKVEVVIEDRKAAVNVPVTNAAPGVFTYESSGTGQGAILNQDFSLNSTEHPADAGTIIAVYVTGVGQTDPPGEDGKMNDAVVTGNKVALPVKGEISGQEAEILYAGPAPGLISGVFQINMRVPRDVIAGPDVSLAIIIGEVRSQPGVTVSIR